MVSNTECWAWRPIVAQLIQTVPSAGFIQLFTPPLFFTVSYLYYKQCKACIVHASYFFDFFFELNLLETAPSSSILNRTQHHTLASTQYTHKHTHTSTHTHARTHTHTHARTHIHTRTRTHTYTRAPTFTMKLKVSSPTKVLDTELPPDMTLEVVAMLMGGECGISAPILSMNGRMLAPLTASLEVSRASNRCFLTCVLLIPPLVCLKPHSYTLLQTCTSHGSFVPIWNPMLFSCPITNSKEDGHFIFI